MKRNTYLVAGLALVLALVLVLGCSQPTPTTTAPPKTTAAPAPTTTAAPAPTTTAAPKPTATPTATAPAAPEFTWKYNGYFAPNAFSSTDNEKWMVNRVVELSKGRIKIEYYPSQQLGPNTEQIRILGSGTAQMGYMVNSFYTGTMPILGVFDLPFQTASTDVAGDITVKVAALHQPVIFNGFLKQNCRLVNGSGSGWGVTWMKSPIRKLEDWKGKKIRGGGALQSSSFIAMGATPQTITSSEVYSALSTGVVDGAVFSPSSAWDNKLYEVIKYAIVPQGSLQGNTGDIFVNQDAWNKLPPDLQNVVNQAAKDAEAHVIKAFSDNWEVTMTNFAAKGVERINITGAEMDRWRAAVQTVYDKWLTDNGADGKIIYDFIQAELAKMPKK